MDLYKKEYPHLEAYTLGVDLKNSSTSERQNAVPKEWSTLQHSPVVSSICKQVLTSVETCYSNIER